MTIPFTDNGRRIFDLRYPRKDDQGLPAETPDETVDRVVSNVSIVNALYEVPDNDPEREAVPLDEFPWRTALRQAQWLTDHRGDADYVERIGFASGYLRQREKYRELISSLTFLPNSPTWTGAGTPLGQLAACFVLPIDDDLVTGRASIFETLKVAAAIQQTGGGNGFSFSNLRPSNAIVERSMGRASGPMGFLRVYDAGFGEIAQGGSRRGANMGVLRIDHPDIETFIESKTVEGEISNFNISVAITDAFMEAVEKDIDFDLVHDGKVYRTIRARDLWGKITQNAWVIGDPGNLFIDQANRYNPVPTRYALEATNPCVTGDTLVATPEGWRRVDEIIEGDRVCTILGEGEVKTVEVHESMPVYKVTFSDGGSVTATAAHQFHVRDSRTKFFAPTRLDQIATGQWVRVAKGAIPHHPAPANHLNLPERDYGFLIGLLLGDGSYTERSLNKNVVRVATHSEEHEWNDVIRLALESIGCDSVSSYTNAGSRSMMMDPKPGRVAADWVRSTLLTPAKSIEKFIPEGYVNTNEDFLVGLLDGLFSTDGSVDLSSNHPLVRFHTGSPTLAEQVRRVLLMFGIHGRVCTSKRREHQQSDGRIISAHNPKYDVVVSGESFGRFVERITLSHPDKQDRLDQARLLCNFTGGNWAAKVVSIEPAGMAKVYDLYEPHSDTWITDGYVSRGCGEQWLGPYENCCLGSIAVNRFVTRTWTQAYKDGGTLGTFDWEGFREAVILSTQFLDDVVDANQYVSIVPELEAAAQGGRRIGLGLMGLSDAMILMGIRYGSPEGLDFASQVTEFARFWTMMASTERAKERGPFEWITNSIYDPVLLGEYGDGSEVTIDGVTFNLWEPPTPLLPHRLDLGRPLVDWDHIVERIKSYGIRNSCQFTFAPTGTISNVAGLEGSGCEPLFALNYIRTVMQEGENIRLPYLSTLFEDALDDMGLTTTERAAILEAVVDNGGSCQGLDIVPETIRNVFVVAADVTPTEHIYTQAVLQRYVDNSISKTINMPNEATVEDVANAYRLAYDLGCKGITIYRQGSRELEVLATTTDKKGNVVDWPSITPLAIPKYASDLGLSARVFPVDTFYGKVQVTFTFLEGYEDRPFDVRLQLGKAGNDMNANVEALGRMISLALRGGISVEYIVEQLEGIGGQTFHGFGESKVRSVADGVAKLFRRLYMADVEWTAASTADEERLVVDTTMTCPNCGMASVVVESGCRHCDVRLGGCGEFSGCD